MPSAFPGMDPFIENQEWEDFHTTLNTVIAEFLVPLVEPLYVVRLKRRVYAEHAMAEMDQSRRADVAILAGTGETAGRIASGAAATIAPVDCVLPMPEERQETFLVIRERESMEVVTVLETLSPANKRPGSDGRREYLRKREAILESQAHLIEFDLLRGGGRLPTLGPLPPADYYAIVSRERRRPRAEVYAWSIRQPLPSIPVPLKKDDPDVPLDLQAVFTTVYDRARYELSLNYRKELSPPLEEAEADWMREVLAAE